VFLFLGNFVDCVIALHLAISPQVIAGRETPWAYSTIKFLDVQKAATFPGLEETNCEMSLSPVKDWT
jgi:hypothetical protein